MKPLLLALLLVCSACASQTDVLMIKNEACLDGYRTGYNSGLMFGVTQFSELDNLHYGELQSRLDVVKINDYTWLPAKENDEYALAIFWIKLTDEEKEEIHKMILRDKTPSSPCDYWIEENAPYEMMYPPEVHQKLK